MGVWRVFDGLGFVEDYILLFYFLEIGDIGYDKLVWCDYDVESSVFFVGGVFLVLEFLEYFVVGSGVLIW